MEDDEMLVFQTDFMGARKPDGFRKFLMNYEQEKPVVAPQSLITWAMRIENNDPRIAEVVDKAAKYYDMDPNLIWAVIFKESSAKYYSVNTTGYDGKNYYSEPRITPEAISLTQCHDFDLKEPVGKTPEAGFLREIWRKGENNSMTMGSYLENAIKNKDSDLLVKFGTAKSLGDLEARLTKCVRPMFVVEAIQVPSVLQGQIKSNEGLYDSILKAGDRGLPISGLNGAQFYVSKYSTHEHDKYSIVKPKTEQKYLVCENITLSKADKAAVSKLPIGGQHIIGNANGNYAFLVEKGKDGDYVIYNFRKRIAPGEEIGRPVNQEYAVVKAAARIKSHIDEYGDVALVYPAYTGGDGTARKLSNKENEFGDISENTSTFLKIYRELIKANFHKNFLEGKSAGVKAECEKEQSFVDESRRPLGPDFFNRPLTYNASAKEVKNASANAKEITMK